MPWHLCILSIPSPQVFRVRRRRRVSLPLFIPLSRDHFALAHKISLAPPIVPLVEREKGLGEGKGSQSKKKTKGVRVSVVPTSAVAKDFHASRLLQSQNPFSGNPAPLQGKPSEQFPLESGAAATLRAEGLRMRAVLAQECALPSGRATQSLRCDGERGHERTNAIAVFFPAH